MNDEKLLNVLTIAADALLERNAVAQGSFVPSPRVRQVAARYLALRAVRDLRGKIDGARTSGERALSLYLSSQRDWSNEGCVEPVAGPRNLDG
jgi:hypothetical protein